MNWAAIEGYEGIYAVSDTGEVMSMNYKKSKLPGLMTQRIRRRYLSVFLSKPGHKEKNFPVHTLVAAAFIGPRPTGLAINHKNGIRTDNRAENLEYCTYSENSKHSFTTGAQCNKGEQHSQHKLTEDMVREIKSKRWSGISRKALAEEYGVSVATIYAIVTGRRWNHVSAKVH